MEKDLGVIITSDLKSSQQCSQSYAKANRILGMIKQTICHKNTDILLQLYKSLVRSQLEYCTAAWCPHYQKNKKLLEKVQRHFTRTIPGLKEVPNEIRLKRLKLWTLEDRRILVDLIEVFKMFRGLSVVDIDA